MVTLRERILKSKLYKIVIWVTLFGVAGGIALMELVKSVFVRKPWALVINRQTIYEESFARNLAHMSMLIEGIKQQYGQYAELYMRMMGMNPNIKDQTAEQLIQETLLQQQAARLGAAFDTSFLETKLRDSQFLYRHPSLVPLALVDPKEGISLQGLHAYLKQANLSMAALYDHIAQSVRTDLLLSLVAASSYIPQFVLKDSYAVQNAKKKFAIARLSLDDLLKKEKETALDAKELELFFTAHSNSYKVPERRSGTVWRFEPGQYGISIAPAEVERYYEAHKMKQYVEKPVQIQVRKILLPYTPENKAQQYEQAQHIRGELIKDPSLFAQKAQELSHDKESASQGGLLPFFSRGTHDRELEKAAFMLKNDGDISPVITTQAGFEIVQRVAKTPQTFKPLALVDREIKDILIQQAFHKQFLHDFQERKATIKSEQAARNEFFTQKKAQGHALKRERLDQASTDTSKKTIQTLFATPQGEFAAYIDGDIGFVVHTTSIDDASMPSLASIRETVEHDLYTQRASDTMRSILQQAKQALVLGEKTLDQVAGEHGFTVERTEFIDQNDQERLKLWRERGLPVEAMLRLEKVGATIAHTPNGQGFLIQLAEIAPVDMAAFQARKDPIALEGSKEQHRYLIAGFVASLYRIATIEINQSLIQ
jgi:parvulin-like peptidyl-prolyl isomerase